MKGKYCFRAFSGVFLKASVTVNVNLQKFPCYLV
jgi:hypothetical protein